MAGCGANDLAKPRGCALKRRTTLPHDVCFGGKDLSELFIACGDKIYKRQTKAHGYISGQMAPIKPAPPKL